MTTSPPAGAGWPARLEALGVTSAAALKYAASEPEDSSRFAWIIETAPRKSEPGRWAAAAVLRGWTPSHSWRRRHREAVAHRARLAAWSRWRSMDAEDRRHLAAILGLRLPEAEIERPGRGYPLGAGEDVESIREHFRDRETAP